MWILKIYGWFSTFSFIFNAQRDLYPSLLLFPAERKEAVPYEGDIAVSEIINFIADHGSNSERLFGENGN